MDEEKKAEQKKKSDTFAEVVEFAVVVAVL